MCSVFSEDNLHLQNADFISKNHRPKKMVTAFSTISAFAGQFSPSNWKGLDGRVRSESILNSRALLVWVTIPAIDYILI